MTGERAQRTANVILGVAALGAAWYVLRTPELRRTVFQLAGAALTGTVPSWLNDEIRRAWAETGARAAGSAGVA